MNILIENASIVTMNSTDDPIIKGNIVISDGQIAAIGSQLKGQPIYQKMIFDKIIDGSNKAVLPGLINSHTHAAMSLFRGFGDDMALMDWLFKRIFPVEDKLQAADVLAGSRLAILEMLKSGTTCFADMYFFCEQLAQAVEEAGIRAVISRGINSFADDGGKQKLAEALAFAQNYQNSANGLITTMIAPHAPYTCNKEYLADIAACARQHQIPLHIHLAETEDENRQILERDNCRPTALLHAVDFFKDNHVLAAHCVYLNEEELVYLKNYNFHIAHNPISNMKLASGLAPISQAFKQGLNIGLGTDSACSNNNLDMFEEIKLAAIMAKLREKEATALPAYQALQMATVNGAKALALNKCGYLATGMKADLILIDLDKPHFYPRHDLIPHLVYAASGHDVDTVIINGQIIMENRQMLTLDEEKICYEAEKVAQDLCYHRN